MKKLHISDEYIIRKGWRIDLEDVGDFEIGEREISCDGILAHISGTFYPGDSTPIDAILEVRPMHPEKIQDGDDVLEDGWEDWNIE